MAQPIPRAAATLILLRDGAAGLEVFMLQRSASLDFAAGAFVFPGGAVDQADGAPQMRSRVLALDDDTASRRLKLPGGGLDFYVAAARESFEEAGILLALEKDGRPVPRHFVERLASERANVESGALPLVQLLERENLFLPGDRLAYFAHWITAPGRTRRYTTRFFAAIAPADQDGLHDECETVASCWTRPQDALARHDRGEIELVFPTRASLTELSQFETAAEAFAYITARQDDVDTDAACWAIGSQGRRLFRRTDAEYAEIHWSDPEETGESTYDLTPLVPKQLDRYVTRVVAPNASPMTGPGTNTYLVGTNEIVVIDPGPNDPEHINAILAASPGRIRWIVVTHTHIDHSPGAMPLKAATGAEVIGAAPAEASGHDPTFKPDRQPEDGQRLELGDVSIVPIATPGHASNHFCYLFEPTRMLFTGDHVMQGSTVVISPPDGNMQAYLASLARLQQEEFAIFAPGHGFLIGNPASELRRLVAHRLVREAKIVELLSEHCEATAEELLPAAYDDVSQAMHPVALRSLLAHLEKLAAEGRAENQGGRWRIRS